MSIAIKNPMSTALRPRHERINARGRETLSGVSRAEQLGIEHREPTIQELLQRSLYRDQQIFTADDETDETNFEVFDDELHPHFQSGELPEHTPFTEGFIDQHAPSIIQAYKTLEKAGKITKDVKGKKTPSPRIVQPSDDEEPQDSPE